LVSNDSCSIKNGALQIPSGGEVSEICGGSECWILDPSLHGEII
jgi:hypothetical protein